MEALSQLATGPHAALALPTLHTICTNITGSPDEPKFRRLRL